MQKVITRVSVTEMAGALDVVIPQVINIIQEHLPGADLFSRSKFEAGQADIWTTDTYSVTILRHLPPKGFPLFWKRKQSERILRITRSVDEEGWIKIYFSDPKLMRENQVNIMDLLTFPDIKKIEVTSP